MIPTTCESVLICRDLEMSHPLNNKSLFQIKRRDASLDAFRCVLMFLIVLYHSFCHGLWIGKDFDWSLMLSSLLCWHVDAFVALSGWFGLKFSARKFCRLWGTIFFYNVLSWAYLLANGNGLQLRVGAGWFGGTYLMFLMISPLLNMLIDRLCEKSSKEILFAWGLFALAITLEWFPRNAFTAVSPAGIDKGYSIIMFVFVYLTARLVRLKNVVLKDWQLALGATVYFGGVLSLNRLLGLLTRLGFERSDYTTYNAPHVIVMAIIALYFAAKRLKLPQWVGRIAIFLAPSMFGVYLLHDVVVFGHQLYKIPQMMLYERGAHPILAIVCSACIAFCAGILVDLFRRVLLIVLGRIIHSSSMMIFHRQN